MSLSSLLPMRPERLQSWLLSTALLLCCAVSVPVTASELPAAVSTAVPELQLHGSAVMRRFGFKIYTARLWTGREGYRADAPYALDLEYAMAIDGAALVKTSVSEMRGLGYTDELLLTRWAQAMTAAFPDVKKGDRLIGVARPGVEARFYSAQGFLASITDPAFVDAFFGIWLNTATSAPKARAELLNAGTSRR
jgi:Chalcone isomerase-like